MPLIQVNMLEGRTDEQKRALLVAITKACEEVLSVSVSSIRVWIQEFSAHDFITAGTIAADRDTDR